MSVIESKLKNCEKQSNEIISMNKQLTVEMIKCDMDVQKCNQLLDNLFYSNEPVTKDGIVCDLLSIFIQI